MKPFLTFRAPDQVGLRFRPKGKQLFHVRIWVKKPFIDIPDTNEFTVKDPITLSELKLIMDDHANELMDLAQCELYEHWSTFLLSINDSTTEEAIDQFFDNFPTLDYGYECYVWKFSYEKKAQPIINQFS